MSEEVDELRAWTARLESDVADLALQLQQTRDELADAVAGGSVRSPSPTFAQVDEWVSGWFSETLARNVTPMWRWCARWAEHCEARERLTALFVAWREAQQSGRMLTWFRDADAQLAALSDAAGPFAACTPERHHRVPKLPYELPEADLFEESGL